MNLFSLNSRKSRHVELRLGKSSQNPSTELMPSVWRSFFFPAGNGFVVFLETLQLFVVCPRQNHRHRRRSENRVPACVSAVLALRSAALCVSSWMAATCISEVLDLVINLDVNRVAFELIQWSSTSAPSSTFLWLPPVWWPLGRTGDSSTCRCCMWQNPASSDDLKPSLGFCFCSAVYMFIRTCPQWLIINYAGLSYTGLQTSWTHSPWEP